MNKIYSEYYVLTEKLDEINWALGGSCNDIDCDRYLYKNLLKKKYKPVLEHNFSCMKKLKLEKEALMRILSLKRFRKFRYKKCFVCKKNLDKLSESSVIASFTKPSKFKGQKAHQWDGKWVHRKCRRKVRMVRMIYQDTEENRKRVKQVEKDLQPMKYRFLHTDYLSPILTIIFENKIMFGLWHKEPFATLIENKEVANSYRNYFEMLWKIAKP